MQDLLFFSVKVLASLLLAAALTYLLNSLLIISGILMPMAAIGVSILAAETLLVASFMIVFNEYSISAFSMLTTTIFSAFIAVPSRSIWPLLLPPLIGLFESIRLCFDGDNASNKLDHTNNKVNQSTQTNMSFFSETKSDSQDDINQSKNDFALDYSRFNFV